MQELAYEKSTKPGYYQKVGLNIKLTAMGKEVEPLCKIRDIYRYISDFEVEFYAKYGIKLNEGMLLCSLSKYGDCSSGQIAEMLGLTLSNSSKVILSAERKELIQRTMGTKDKRQMFFSLTSKGKEYLKNIHCESENILELLGKIRSI